MLFGKKAQFSSWAGFSTLCIEVHEQRQNRLDKTENKLEPLEFVHDITPSRLRGSRTTLDLLRKIYHTFRKLSIRRAYAWQFFSCKPKILHV